MEDKVLRQLRQIILEEEQQDKARIRREMDQLRQQVQQSADVSTQVVPIVDQRLETLKMDLGQMNSAVIMEAIEIKIKESKGEMVEILYPIIGGMVKKYVMEEMQNLSERVDKQLDEMFSFDKLWKGLVNKLRGKKDSQSVIAGALPVAIEEVYLVHKESGLLLAGYSRNGTLNQEVIASMLTAVKSFAEDAFQSEGVPKPELDGLQYGTFRIVLQNLHRFYLAVALSGVVTAAFKRKLSQDLLQFGAVHVSHLSENLSQDQIAVIEQALQEYFAGYSY